MPLDTPNSRISYKAEEKELYEVGEVPPLGYVPKNMYAWAIRRDRHGEPDDSFKVEVVETPSLDSNEVLIFVMAAGVNYNGIWAGLGIPISPFGVLEITIVASPEKQFSSGETTSTNIKRFLLVL